MTDYKIIMKVSEARYGNGISKKQIRWKAANDGEMLLQANVFNFYDKKIYDDGYPKIGHKIIAIQNLETGENLEDALDSVILTKTISEKFLKNLRNDLLRSDEYIGPVRSYADNRYIR
jgi:hypothetical protein